MARLRVGVDVGGTFTDVVGIDQHGRVAYVKVSSTPADPSAGVLEGLERLLRQMRARAADVDVFVHGTTVATNTLLERTGARVGLITTEGFRDVLHIGRQSRPHLYDLFVRRPAPLVPRRFRREVRERTLHTGDIDTRLDPLEVSAIAREFEAAGIEVIAICFLHSYANPDNERDAANAVRAAAPGTMLSVSSEILPEMREFERMNTTVLNAYVQPAVGRYLERLSARLEDARVPSRLHIMRSNGGVASMIRASAHAVQTLLSGPAGGVLGATLLSEVTGLRDLITVDVGGTSFDVAVVEQGRPAVVSEGVIEGYPVKFPHISIHTIGAGGGSIAWLDHAGALRVGPHSAGAEPGPVCYRRGGTQPTVTDAHATLGRLGALLEGEMPVDIEAARVGLAELGGRLEISPDDVADGVLRVVNAAMTRAIRVVTVERGIDPRRFTLVAYGGAGPLHAVDLARGLGIGSVLVPVAPGNFSALGLLAAPVREDRVRAFHTRASTAECDTLESIFVALEREAATVLTADRFSPDEIRYEREADLRYVGQAYELTIPVPEMRLTSGGWSEVITGFHRAHERTYGFSKRDDPVELMNLRVAALVDLERHRWAAQALEDGTPAPFTRRAVRFGGQWDESPVYRRHALRPGQRFSGPAIVEEMGATTVLAPEDTADVDAWGNLRISVGHPPVHAPAGGSA